MELVIYLGMMLVIVLLVMILHISGVINVEQELNDNLLAYIILLIAWPFVAFVLVAIPVVFVVCFFLYTLANIIVKITKLDKLVKWIRQNDKL